MEDVVERFTRAEVFLTCEAMFWAQPRSTEHWQMPVVLDSADAAMSFFRGLGFG